MALFGGNVLYYPGCVTKFYLKDIMINYQKLLKAFGVKLVTINEMEKCCGIEALEAGYRKEFYDIIDHNESVLQQFKINKIVTNCPRCVRAFNDFYGVPTEHILSLIMKNARKLREKEGDITYYDGAELGRKLKIYEEPRAILRTVGYNVINMADNKEYTLCCGAGGGLERNSPKVADKIAQMVLSKVKTEKLVTADPICYHHLKKNAKHVKVLELSEVLI